MQLSVWVTEIFVFVSPTLMNRDCAGSWYLHGTSSSLLCFREPSSAPWLCCPKLQKTPFTGVFLAREKRLCHLIMQAVGEPSCWSIRNAHLGWPQDGPLGTILGSSSRRWGWERPCRGSRCPRAASQGCEFKIKSVYWIFAVGALRYRSNRMILSQLYLELHIANAKR